jgi:4-hydroxyphenylpyruvate dioxygenase
MGPYPHDAPPATISPENPAGTDGFAFVEFAHPDAGALTELFAQLGFAPAARHKRKAVELFRQGDVCFLVNCEPDSHAVRFAAEHGPCASAMGWYVVDPLQARAHALRSDPGTALPADTNLGLDLPAIRGIGGSLIYFADRPADGASGFENEFEWAPGVERAPVGELSYIDHLTHNVNRGRMDAWAAFYERIFGFKQIRYFDIEGKHTGLFSRAMTSPCGKIRIPINESADARSQIEEYLRAYKGEGIQHIALGCADIYAAVDTLRSRGVPFLAPPPARYYEKIDGRVTGHGEPLAELAARGILIDGEGVVDGGSTRVLLQIFSATVIGPIFFEFIERKGDDGFGEGNFRALFESIEEDQSRRGVLDASAAKPVSAARP